MGPGSAAGTRESLCCATYFRTQITRTTAAFASVALPLAVTLFAFRKSRTLSAETIIACAAGAAGPATITGFSSGRIKSEQTVCAGSIAGASDCFENCFYGFLIRAKVRRKSSFIDGAGDDAADLAAHLSQTLARAAA